MPYQAVHLVHYCEMTYAIVHEARVRVENEYKRKGARL